MHLTLLMSVVFSGCFLLANAFYNHEDTYHTCCASGDPHYYPYDGGVIHYQGTCRYLLTGTCPCSKVSDVFKVFVENERIGSLSVSRTRLVDIEIHGYRVRFEENGSIKIWGPDGNQIFPLVYPFTFHGVTVSQSGWTLTLTTSDGIEVVYSDNHRVCVTVPCKYREELCGICGNLNGVFDEYTTSDGTDVTNDPNKYTLIGDSWQVPPVQPSTLGRKCYSMQSGGSDYKPQTRVTNEFCEMIAQAEQCPGFEQHAESCRYDVAAQEGNEQAHCQTLESFIRGCPQLLVTIRNWRALAKCPCPDGSYSDPCPLHCPDGTYNYPCKSIVAADSFISRRQRRR